MEKRDFQASRARRAPLAQKDLKELMAPKETLDPKASLVPRVSRVQPD